MDERIELEARCWRAIKELALVEGIEFCGDPNGWDVYTLPGCCSFDGETLGRANTAADAVLAAAAKRLGAHWDD